jgi:hypothetical protein
VQHYQRLNGIPTGDSVLAVENCPLVGDDADMLIVVLGVRGGFDTSMTLHFHALRVINAICNA